MQCYQKLGPTTFNFSSAPLHTNPSASLLPNSPASLPAHYSCLLSFHSLASLPPRPSTFPFLFVTLTPHTPTSLPPHSLALYLPILLHFFSAASFASQSFCLLTSPPSNLLNTHSPPSLPPPSPGPLPPHSPASLLVLLSPRLLSLLHSRDKQKHK